MLERVSQGQSRCMTPGLAPDPRGILLGRFGLLTLSTFEGVVSWFRLYSAEASLDEILPSLQILHVRTALQSREHWIRIEATSSYLMDAAARCARLVGGEVFTGSSKHFVKYRDSHSPYGYDTPEIEALPEGTQFMLHRESFAQSYTQEHERTFESMLFRLSLQRTRTSDTHEKLWLVVESGLRDGIMRYLWRNKIEANVGMVHSKEQSAFTHGDREFLLFSVSSLPKRIRTLFQDTPGIYLFARVNEQIGVQLGYQHPIDLHSCQAFFPSDCTYLFWGENDRVDVLAGPLQLSSIAHLTQLTLKVAKAEDRVQSLASHPLEPLDVSLKLAPSLAPRTQSVATLVSIEHAAWVKHLVYLLPSKLLQNTSMAITDRGILLVGAMDNIPLGQALIEMAPGLLIPLGMELLPRVSPSVLTHALGHSPSVFTVFPATHSPFQVNKASLVPLERSTIAKLELPVITTHNMEYEALCAPSVHNDDVGNFALWGFHGPKDP